MNYLADVIKELKSTTWYRFLPAVKMSLLVVLIVVVLSGAYYGLDTLFTTFFKGGF